MRVCACACACACVVCTRFCDWALKKQLDLEDDDDWGDDTPVMM